MSDIFEKFIFVFWLFGYFYKIITNLSKTIDQYITICYINIVDKTMEEMR